MNKSTLSLLLAAMMATSGFAVAQTGVKAGTDGGSGPSAAEKAAPGNMPNTRAEVKSEIVPQKSGTQGGEGPIRGAAAGSSGDVPANTRADVKAQAKPMKSGIQGGSGASPDANPNTANASAKASTTSAERKAARAERKAARKAKRDAAMASSAKPAVGQTEGKAQ